MKPNTELISSRKVNCKCGLITTYSDITKPRATTKQQARTVSKKLKVSQKPQVQKTHHHFKNGTCSQKCLASDGSNSTGSLEGNVEAPCARPRKKVRCPDSDDEIKEVEDGENEVKQVVDGEDDTKSEDAKQVSRV